MQRRAVLPTRRDCRRLHRIVTPQVPGPDQRAPDDEAGRAPEQPAQPVRSKDLPSGGERAAVVPGLVPGAGAGAEPAVAADQAGLALEEGLEEGER